MGDETPGVTIPQPLVVGNYKSRDAVIADIAIRIFANADFDSSMAKSPYQTAKNAIANAKLFAEVAGTLIDELVTPVSNTTSTDDSFVP